MKNIKIELKKLSIIDKIAIISVIIAFLTFLITLFPNMIFSKNTKNQNTEIEVINNGVILKNNYGTIDIEE